MTTTDTTVDNLIINTMTAQQYSQITPSTTELYMVIDDTEIPAGTVIEGKFSDLPTFFAGLEGKYCNGTLTYKITQDETITGGFNEIVLTNTNIPEIIIDGNEKTISYTANANFIPLIRLTLPNITAVLQNITIQLTNPSSYTASLVSFRGAVAGSESNKIFGVIRDCTFKEASDFAIGALGGSILSIGNIEVSTTNKNGMAVAAFGTSRISIRGSVINNCTRACSSTEGGIIQAFNLTLSNNTSNYYTATGGQIFHN